MSPETTQSLQNVPRNHPIPPKCPQKPPNSSKMSLETTQSLQNVPRNHPISQKCPQKPPNPSKMSLETTKPLQNVPRNHQTPPKTTKPLQKVTKKPPNPPKNHLDARVHSEMFSEVGLNSESSIARLTPVWLHSCVDARVTPGGMRGGGGKLKDLLGGLE